MGKIAFVFPGQGAQTVGMGKDIIHIPEVKALYDKADEALGLSLSTIIFEGPNETLKQTAYTQPALLTTSLAYLEAFRQAGGTVKPDYAAGHSLGEWTALAACGSLTSETAAKLVHMRGRFMEEAVPGGRGAMAAVLGAERKALQALCDRISAEVGVVEPANVNCPGQIVVSGSREGVEAVIARGKEEAGAKRVIPLEVSGPFHSSLMQPAAEKLEELLSEAHLAAPAVPVIANVTADVVTEPGTIRSLLVKQVCAPVLWEDSVLRLIALGVDTFVEFGPGSVLSGLIKKTNKEVQTLSVNSAEAAVQAAEQLG